MSRTGISVRSGYWMVVGRRSRWESVMLSPSQMDVKERRTGAA